MTWQRDDPALYEREKADVEAHFPELRFVVQNDLVYVRGSFAVMFEGQVLDRYSVELQLPRNHPNGLPVVRETGGRTRAVRTATSIMLTEPLACLFRTSVGVSGRLAHLC